MNNHQNQKPAGKEKSRYRYGQPGKNYIADGFTCGHCHSFVTTDSGLSGVHNRNHCPFCLWSRHLDLFAVGDRLSACKALMQPVGLTIKLTRKKYGPGHGELMLIHLCEECTALSINRIAADDDPQRLLTVFEGSFHLDARLLSRLESDDIDLLTGMDGDAIHAQLFGPGPDLAEMLFHVSTAAPSMVQEDSS